MVLSTQSRDADVPRSCWRCLLDTCCHETAGWSSQTGQPCCWATSGRPPCVSEPGAVGRRTADGRPSTAWSPPPSLTGAASHWDTLVETRNFHEWRDFYGVISSPEFPVVTRLIISARICIFKTLNKNIFFICSEEPVNGFWMLKYKNRDILGQVNYLLTSSLHRLHTNFGAASTLMLVCRVVSRGICSGTVQKWTIMRQIVNFF